MQQCTRLDRNLQTHTYKLEDSKGDRKVVHCNLVLDISFLPVVTNAEGQCDTETKDLDCVEEEDTGVRTSDGMMSGSEDGQSQETVSEEWSNTDQSGLDAPELGYDESSEDDQIDHLTWTV